MGAAPLGSGHDDQRRDADVRAPMKGYGGRILFVDLTRGTSRVQSLDEGTARPLLGGNGPAARLLLHHVPAPIHPYGPANAVGFAVGPVPAPTAAGNLRACA